MKYLLIAMMFVACNANKENSTAHEIALSKYDSVKKYGGKFFLIKPSYYTVRKVGDISMLYRGDSVLVKDWMLDQIEIGNSIVSVGYCGEGSYSIQGSDSANINFYDTTYNSTQTNTVRQ